MQQLGMAVDESMRALKLTEMIIGNLWVDADLMAARAERWRSAPGPSGFDTLLLPPGR